MDSVETALNWAEKMTWNGISPVVHLSTQVYETGKKLTEQEMKVYETKIERNKKLPKWDVIIPFKTG